MNIEEYISEYKNHPVLFVGTGISLRYLKDSYTWDGLLDKVSHDLTGNQEFYLDIKSRCQIDGKFKFDKIASELEEHFNLSLSKDRNGKFKEINDIFYSNMEKGVNISRLKIYIASILSDMECDAEMLDEIRELKKIRKNVGSIITTNYDRFIEDTFEFTPLIGNDILLSNPYGSVYKIHGCVTEPSKMIITENDYKEFMEKYELIRAQLLSLFIHNPIIFIGYSIGDENIKNILKTIFTYIAPNSEEAETIRRNFLLVEYDENSNSNYIAEHDIELEGFPTIRINKIKTNDFKPIYTSISDLHLPISAMDIRKVQNVVKEIYSGGQIKVSITEDLDSLKNSDRIVAIGSSKTISYQYQTSSEMMSNYFKILDESNKQLLALIDKYSIQKNQYFPIYGFSTIRDGIEQKEKLKQQQYDKLMSIIQGMSPTCKNTHTDVKSIFDDATITRSSKSNALVWAILNNDIELDEVEDLLRNFVNKEDTDYRKLLCAYDYKKYNDD